MTNITTTIIIPLTSMVLRIIAGHLYSAIELCMKIQAIRMLKDENRYEEA
jgi:hypothetical protein